MSVSVQDQLGDRLIALEAEVKRLRGNLLQLFYSIGTPNLCRGCRAQIWTVYHSRSRHNQVYDSDAGMHNCPHRGEFRRAIEEGR